MLNTNCPEAGKRRHVHGHIATYTNMTLESVKGSSAGSPSKILLRLLLPLSDEFAKTSREQINLRINQRICKRIGATGGVRRAGA